MSDTTEYLHFISVTIGRMANHSFAIKGWSITVVSALVAIGINQDNPDFALLAILPAAIFWGLDAYYLRQERLFRCLWNEAASADDDAQVSFSMDTSPYRRKKPYYSALFAGVVVAIYVPTILGALLIATRLK